jgi:hypothetical protein
MQFCWIGLQIETKNTGAVVLRRGFSTKICRSRRRKCAFVVLETHPSKKPRLGADGFRPYKARPEICAAFLLKATVLCARTPADDDGGQKSSAGPAALP